MDDELAKCFESLEVSPDSSWNEVQRAYRELVKVWHPDRFVSDPRLQRRAERKLAEINAAYRKLEEHHLTPAAQASAPSAATAGFQHAPPEPASPPRPGADRAAFRLRRRRFWSAPRFQNLSRVRPRSLPRPGHLLRSELLTALGVMALLAGGFYLFRFFEKQKQLESAARLNPTGTRSKRGDGARVHRIVKSQVALPETEADRSSPDAGENSYSRYARGQAGQRPENGTELVPSRMSPGAGTIRIVNHREEDLVAEIWEWGSQKRIARAVYARSGEEVTLSDIGLGVYRARFQPASGTNAGVTYAPSDLMQFYEVAEASGVQAVVYVITIP